MSRRFNFDCLQNSKQVCTIVEKIDQIYANEDRDRVNSAVFFGFLREYWSEAIHLYRYERSNTIFEQLGCVAQSVTCLATYACLTADPGVASSIPVRPHTFVEIVHEMISTVILLPSAESFKKGCCQLQAKVCARITG